VICRAQAERLDAALEAAAACVEQFAVRHGGARELGSGEAAGESAAAEDGAPPAELCAGAVRAYERWAGAVGADAAARETDAALGAVRAAVSASLAGLFVPAVPAAGSSGGAAGPAGDAEAVRAALCRGGAALVAEEAAQSKDFFADMPRGRLLRAGRALAGARGAAAAALGRLAAAAADVGGELAGLDGMFEGGALFQAKRDAKQDLANTTKGLKKAKAELKKVQADIDLQDSDSDDGGGGGGGGASGADLARRKAEWEGKVQEALDARRGAVARLAGLEAAFPELGEQIGAEVPRGLLGVWRVECELAVRPPPPRKRGARACAARRG